MTIVDVLYITAILVRNKKFWLIRDFFQLLSISDYILFSYILNEPDLCGPLGSCHCMSILVLGSYMF